jgi:para-nitrobenzyl esterase
MPRIDRRSFLRTSGSAVAGGLLMTQHGAPLAAQDAPLQPSAVVSSSEGKLRGAMINGVSAFKGIRYGAPTGGAARFLPPARPEPWTGVRDAFELGERAPQGGQDIMFITFPALERSEPEGEDCLRLNLWTNGVGAGKRPVMVWLHGGAYVTGSGGFAAYDGANLARQEDVVVVTVNHRLNAFGFLHVAAIGGAKYARSANLGMQDIVAALRWVRENVANFGGDADNVTIFGQSGGGGKVSTLLAMPSAKGLFHRAIIQSGSTLRQNSAEDATVLAHRFLARLKLGSVDELQQLPMERMRAEVIAALGTGPLLAPPSSEPAFTALSLGPVVDGHVLPTHPFDPVAPALSADVPLLVGTNESEITFFPGAPLDPIDEATLRTQVQGLLHTDAAGADTLIAAYRQSRPGATPLDVLQILQSDLFMRVALHAQTERKIAQGRAPVFVYYFNWRTPVLGGRLKACHCLEIPFVMRNLNAMAPMVGTGPELPGMADQISGAWAAFARTGNPNHAGLPHWPAQDLKTRSTMLLNAHPSVVSDPDHAERTALAALMRPAGKSSATPS